MKKTNAKKTVPVRLVRNKLKSAEKAPYLGRVIPEGTIRQEDFLKEAARQCGGTVAQARLAYDTMMAIVREQLAKGHGVETPFGIFELAIGGTVPKADSPLDPKKNKVYVRFTPPKALRRKVAELTPVLCDAPANALMLGEVFTSALGARGYNAVKAGEAFVLTGDGFLAAGTLSVTLTDARGVSHDVTIVTRKKTALVCSFDDAAAKGKAAIEVVLTRDEPEICRFAASRKVTVR